MILIHPSIDPIIFSLGVFQIRWYGLSYVLGFLLGIFLIKKINKKSQNKIESKIIDDFFIWSVLSVIFGGRIGYIIFYQTNIIFKNPLEIFYVWQGGMSFHGGLLGMIFCIFVFSRKSSINFYKLSDLVSLAAPIGLFFGRIANFINVELYGRTTDFAFAMIYPSIDNLPRHPSQLYEALLEGLVLFIILIYFSNKYFIKNIFGIITGAFLIFYSFFRICVEFLREPDSHIGLFFNFISMGQILSIPILILGVIILLIRKKTND